MKYLAVILSGMSDRPFRAYDDETPLSAAFKPNIDMLSSRSFSGFVQNIPASFANVCDAAAWSVIGYPPRKYCSGRAAACVCGNGIRLKKDDAAMMCGFVSLTDDEEYERFLEFKLKKEENEEYFDDYDPELLEEFCNIESIDKKERQIRILIEDYEEYHFNNYQDFEHSIILRYYDEEDYTY